MKALIVFGDSLGAASEIAEEIAKTLRQATSMSMLLTQENEKMRAFQPTNLSWLEAKFI